jgi:hypothetical protein
MKIEIIKSTDNNPVAEFFSSSSTPETDKIEKYDGFKMKESVTTCGDESSAVYIKIFTARQLERNRDKWAKLCGQYKLERDKARTIAQEAITGLYNLGDYDLANRLLSNLEETK